jgi:hypothetical protein
MPERCTGLPPSVPEEPVFRLPPAPVDAKQLQQLGREHDLAWIFPLAFPDVDYHPLAIDIRHLQLLHFRATQAGRVHGGQQRSMLEVDGGIEQEPHLFGAEDGRELASHFGPGDFVIEPAPLQRAGVKKLQG